MNRLRPREATAWVDIEPEASGWYATLICYDPQEGILDGAAYWNNDTGEWEDIE